MPETLMALREVTFGYRPERPVLLRAALELRRGERVALSGRNGAGKSTLLHLLVGLLRPEFGRVEAFGRDCRGERDFAAVRRRAALLFQESDDQLFCPTVVEDVAFGPLNLGLGPREARAAAAAALARVGLEGFEDRVTHHLSAGEKKMAALAALLAMRPEVLLLDEPTAGLDETALQRVTGLLPELDCAMLIVSQDRAFLERVSLRGLVLEDGAVREV